jgi:outer membrane protein assembly factor BamE (lipoprotein component of BamABCDE complex)
MSATALRSAIALGSIALLAGGCTRVQDHKGYVVDSALINSVAPGVDNRDSVMKTLGRPSFASEFDQGATWYYLSRETRQFAFANPNASGQTLLAVRFAASGDVASVQKTGLETIRKVDPYGKKTPTLGRNRGFFTELFGNIGAGGANATRAPTSDNPD